eukprot:3636060-Alexandrium_andersonii.AAC.1
MPADGPRDVAVQARRPRTPGARRHASPDPDREQARDNYQRYLRIHNPELMPRWQNPDIPLDT